MENKPDPLKPNPNPLENRLFEGLKKPVSSTQTPFTYKLTDSSLNAPVPKQLVDMRPTENISSEELAKELDALKKKKAEPSAKVFDPRSKEKYELPQEVNKEKQNLGNPPSLERPTMDISVDQLKKALKEEINDVQVQNIMAKFQKGKAFLPFLQKNSSVAPNSSSSSETATPSSKASNPLQNDDYLPTETISIEELQRVLQEKITPEEIQKILEVGKKQTLSPPPPPPPIYNTPVNLPQPLSKGDSPPPPVYGSTFAPPPPPAYNATFPPPPPPSGTFKAASPGQGITFMPPPQPPTPPGTFKAPSPGHGTAFMAVTAPPSSPLASPTSSLGAFKSGSAPNPNSATIYSANPSNSNSATIYSANSSKSPTSNVNISGQTFQNSLNNKTFSSPAGAGPISAKYDHLPDQPIEEVPPNYRIYEYFLAKKPLGSGGTAYVFEAFIDGARNQPAGIIKLARKGLGKLLMNEIDFAKQYIAKELAHDHLVKYLKTGITPTGLPFLLSEKLTTFPHKELSFEDALAVLSKIADVVYYLHKHHLYHRDLKPENILYALEGKKIIPKIFDLGTVSKQINEHQTVAGTPFYAAPEVLKKIRGYSADEVQFSRADVFSLAMTLLGLVKFNPYLELEPDLEKNYQDKRLLVDRLIEFHETRYAEFILAVEKFLRDKSYAAAITLRSGVKYSPHKELVEALIPIIKSMLQVKPEDRPISTNIAKKIDSIFAEKLGISLDQYLINGCTLNPSET